MLFRYFKGRFSAYSSLVILISRKVMQDKRAVTDFRHLNLWIAKSNLANPLLKDTFTLLGSSKCDVISVLDLKMLSIHFDYLKIPRNIVEFYHTLARPLFYIRGCQWD